MGSTEDLGRDLLALYQRSSFGRVLKAEIDQLVFRHLLAEVLPSCEEGPGGPDFLALDKSGIRKLSLSLGISEARVKQLVESEYLQERARDTRSDHGEARERARLLVRLVKEQRFRQDLVQSGKVRFYLPNPVVRRLLEAMVADVRGIPSYEENREVLVLELEDFFALMGLSLKPAELEKQCRNILGKISADKSVPGFDGWLAELASQQAGSSLSRLLRRLPELVVGEVGGKLLSGIADWVVETVGVFARRTVGAD